MTNSMPDENSAAALADLRKEIARGAYRQAAARAAAWPDALRQAPRAALELGRLRLRQGYVKEAERALQAAKLAQGTAGEKLLLRMEAAALRIYRAADVAGALAEAATVQAEISQSALTAVEQAEAERIHTRILLQGKIYREISADVAQPARDRLPVLAATLAQAGWLDEALAAWLTWAEQQNEAAARQAALSDVIPRCVTAQRFDLAGEAHLLKAEFLLTAGAPTAEIESQLQAAAAWYERATHLHGLVDVRRARARCAVEREAASLHELAACLAEYERLDYPRAALSLLMDLSQIAHERGRTAAAANYRQRSLALAEATGMGLARDNYQLAQMDLLMRANRYREAIELGQAALAAQPVVMLAASYEQLLATAYSFVEDFAAAYQHGQRAIALFSGRGQDESASNAALKLASDLAFARREENWEQAETLLTDWLAHDEARQDWAVAAQKREMLAQIALLRFSYAPLRQGEPAWLERAEQELRQAESLAAHLAGREGARRRGALQQLRGQWLQLRGDLSGVEAAWRAALAIYEPAGLEMEAANCRYLIGVLRLNAANQDLLAHFGESEDQFRAALGYYVAAGMRDRTADTRAMFARLYANAAWRANDELRPQLLTAALDHLTEAERDYDELRRDYAVGTALDAQLGKRTLSKKSRQIYEQAVGILTSAQPDAAEAWRWIQRGKARALSDLLGGAEPPARIMNALATHPASLNLARQERELVSRWHSAVPTERQALRAELDALRQRMAQDEHLIDYLELRTGAALDADDLARLLAGQRACLCVDWFATGERLWMVTVRPGEPPQVWPLRIRLSAVQTFVSRNLTPEVFRDTLRDAPELLHELNELISPLAACSAPEDLLILAPTGPLHALPLHALALQGAPLLVRNPVVYCPSLSVLRLCLERRRAAGTWRTAALFGDPSGNRASAVELVNTLAQTFQTTPLLRADVTRAAFVEHSAECDLIHFQGHAKYDRAEPLDSYLQLADGRCTARDIFGLSGVRAELVTLAACESAASAVAVGDEPLGLIPAFLYSGAQAVLATLWPVHQASATEMMRHFYTALTTADAQTGNVVNKAHALRAAALAIRATGGDFAKPYHWASYVLHGDWRHA